MNKYWIHSCTGDKVIIYDSFPYFNGKDGWIRVMNRDIKKISSKISEHIFNQFYIPITKAEYDSSLTLEEIKRNRKLFFNLVENDEIICESDCKSNCDTDIETGDVLRVKAKGENIAILYGLTESIKNIKLAVEEDTINEHFRLYNQEDRTEEYVRKNKDVRKNKENIKDTFESICQDMIATHNAKNHDYGDSFHNLFKELGINYAYGHLREKLKRVKVLKDNEAKVKGESMIDSLKDLANYAIMTIIELQDGKKN